MADLGAPSPKRPVGGAAFPSPKRLRELQGSCSTSRCAPLVLRCAVVASDDCRRRAGANADRLEWLHISGREHVCEPCAAALTGPFGEPEPEVALPVLPFWLRCVACRQWRRGQRGQRRCSDVGASCEQQGEQFDTELWGLPWVAKLEETSCPVSVVSAFYAMSMSAQEQLTLAVDSSANVVVTAEERKELPIRSLRARRSDYAFGGMWPDAYVQVRNLLLELWHADQTTYLSSEACEERVVASGFARTAFVTFVEQTHRFLTRHGYINAGFVAVPPAVMQSRAPSRVVVVGAGMSGCTVARQLRRMGHEVLVLEAQGRKGGRIVDVEGLGARPVGLGASLIVGLHGNPLVTLCKQLGMPIQISLESCPLIAPEQGGAVAPELDRRAEEQFNALLSKARRRVPRNGGDMSLGAAIAAARTSKEFATHSSPLGVRLVEWHLSNLEYACASKLSEVSARHWDQDDEFALEGHHALVLDGYGRLLDALAEGLDIRLNTPVETVTHGPAGVRVHTVDGETLVADACVVTASIGVLQAGVMRFVPPLSHRLSDAVSRLGFGIISKCLLSYAAEHVFWNPQEEFVGRVPQGEADRGDCFMFWSFPRATAEEPGVVVAFSCGAAADRLEAMGDEEACRHAAAAFSSLYPSQPPAPLRAWAREAWSRNPYVRGAYSSVAVGASGIDYDVLATGQGPRLFFAGEGTNRRFPVSVTGAYLSGMERACALDLALSSLPPPPPVSRSL